MNEKQSLLIELIKLAKVDKEFHEKEYAFLVEIARLLGIEKPKLDELFEKHIEFAPPKLEFGRILQFQRLILLANVDLKVESSELKLLKETGMKMGLNPKAIENVLDEMKKHENGLIPPDKLIDIFKIYHN
jgi:hypothetical protein